MFLAVLRVEGFVQGALRKELIIAPFVKRFKQLLCEGLTDQF